MKGLERMRFRLVVRDVFTLKTSGVVVVGVVEGGSISVGDSVQLRRYEGKSPKLRVEALEIGIGKQANTAEPGMHVGILLRGLTKEQLRVGDILEKPPEDGRLAKALRTFDIVIAIIAIFVVGNLLFGGVMLLFGWRDGQQALFRQTAAAALANMPCAGVIAWEGLASCFWRGKLRQEARDGDYRVLKCSSGYYMLPICGVLLLGMMALLFRSAPAGELAAAWAEGALTFPLLFIFGYNIIAAAFFLYYSRQRVFYSRYMVRLAGFRKSHDIPWARMQTITLARKRKKSRLMVVTAENTIVLRSEVLADGWDDFVLWARRMAEEYRIPFEDKL